MSIDIPQRRSFIITGGNSGLGYATAKHLAEQDSSNHVILACRNMTAADEAVRTLIEKTSNGNITATPLDLASLHSIRAFAAHFKNSTHPPLYALICNAGGINVGPIQHTEDGFESTFGINYLGHFLLTALLVGDMTPSGRILFVSSGTHDPANKTLAAPPVYDNARTLAYPPDDGERSLAASQQRYTTSKLCNVYCAYELADRLRQTGKDITVNAFNPGEMPGTGFSRTFPGPIKFVAKYLNYASVPFRSSVHTPDQSGRALATLVISHDYDQATGKYFDGLTEKRSSADSYDIENRKDLWRTSVELTGLTAAETILDLP